ncbi:MAG: SpoIID/LytB domain-containing protein [Armatimonadetes bacterium]|nr:SpoIID/LytB domain-containing protein [Armatimonadota bacterium]
MKRLLCAAIIVLALLPLAAHCDTSNVVHVGLTRYNDTKAISVTSASLFSVTRTGVPGSLANATEKIFLQAGESEITLKSGDAETPAGTSITLAPTDPSAIFAVESKGGPMRKYRGTLEVSLKDGALRMVNVVNVEDYLLGVLPAEMPELYPEEALKAQAITARTYALRNARKHASQGFDICDGDHCQAYLGVLAEKPKCTRAVLETRGIILTFGSQLASVMYSSDCGGATQNYFEIYPDCKSPYLRGVTEPDGIQHVAWEKLYKLTEIESKLTGEGIKEAEGLKSLTVTKAATSGRALSVDITGFSATVSITGGKLRDILDLKSTLFTIESQTDGTVIIRGKGFGHGVGLCQTGAKSLASPPFGYDCRQILAHYFPGTDLTAPAAPIAKATNFSMIPLKAQGPSPTPARPPASKKKETKPRAPFDVRLEAPENL